MSCVWWGIEIPRWGSVCKTVDTLVVRERKYMTHIKVMPGLKSPLRRASLGRGPGSRVRLDRGRVGRVGRRVGWRRTTSGRPRGVPPARSVSLPLHLTPPLFLSVSLPPSLSISTALSPSSLSLSPSVPITLPRPSLCLSISLAFPR